MSAIYIYFMDEAFKTWLWLRSQETEKSGFKSQSFLALTQNHTPYTTKKPKVDIQGRLDGLLT